jgi:hypothetical protein
MLDGVLGSMNHEGLKYIPLVFWLATERNCQSELQCQQG